MPASDPWLWTTDDLVAELAKVFKKTTFVDKDMPRIETLASHLQKQQITGAVFLTAANSHVIEDETVFSNQGQRKALNSVVELLRQWSPTYQNIANSSAKPLDSTNAASTHTENASTYATSNEKHTQKRGTLTQVDTGRVPPTALTGGDTLLERTAGQAAGQLLPDESQWDHLSRWEELGGDAEMDLEALDRLEEDERDDALEDFIDEDPTEDYDVHELPGEHPEHEGLEGLPVPRRSKLSPEQIESVINDSIAHYTSAWEPNKEVLKEDQVNYDPEKMWLEAESAGQRHELVAKYETDKLYYEQRLNKLCDEIFKSPASTVEKLRHQCSNLEITINSLELAKWLLSIYALEPVSDSDEELENPELSIHSDRSRPSSSLHSRRDSQHMEGVDFGSASKSLARESMNFKSHDEATPNLQAQLNSSDQLNTSVVGNVETPLPSNVSSWPFSTEGSSLLRSMYMHSDEPESASILTVQRWRWEDMMYSRDRKRIVSKTVSEMSPDEREMIRYRMKHVGKSNLVREIPGCIEMLSREQSKMPGVLPRDLPKITTFTRLFFSWWFCANCFRQGVSLMCMEELRQYLQLNAADLGVFCDYLNKIMSTTFNEEALRYPDRPSQSEVIVISDDEDEPTPRPKKSPVNVLKHFPSSQQSTVVILD